MRGNASRYPDAAPTMAQNRTTLVNWLYGARDEVVLAATVETLARRHKIHRDPRENERQVECLLLSRQDALRRQEAARREALGNPI